MEIDDLYNARKVGVYHYWHGWNWRAYLAYIVGIAPNFYGFLNNIGVSAPEGVTKAYYFAYEIGLFVSFGVYWAANWWWPPAMIFPLAEWREPSDYVRTEERGLVVEGRGEGDVESESGGSGRDKKGVGMEGVRVRPTKNF